VEVIEVSDAADPRLADFRNLMDADVRPDRRGIVIAEGTNVVSRLAESAYPIRSVFGVPKKIDALRAVLADRDVPVYVCDKWLLSDVVGFRVTRGVLAAASRPRPADAIGLVQGARRVAVLEGLNDFENLGALFRNAAAFGVDAVLLDPTCADPLYRRSVRVSMGHVLRVPFAVLPEPLPEALSRIRQHGLRLLAMTPNSAADDLRALRAPSRWALLLGAEGPGLSDQALAAADQLVRIPMSGGVDSLNVATAAAVAFAYLA
jgi:tRNA G18 (ribose-2'-O)-methylase SpoU